MGARARIGWVRGRLAPATWTEALGFLVVCVGFVAMTLGVFEIGGLFAIGAGFVGVLAGCVLVFARGSEADPLEEEVFAHQLRDL